MKRVSSYFMSIIILSIVMCCNNLSVFAGELEPSAPPSPTMKPINHVEPRTPISNLPYTISASGSYFLTGDLISAGTGITVNADNVTIDLMGFSIIGPGSVGNHGIFLNNRSNIEIADGTVRNFYHGIYEIGDNSNGVRVIKIRALENAQSGIFLTGGSGHLVKDCLAAGNLGIGANYGIYVNHGSVVTGNAAYDNQGTGIAVGHSSSIINNSSYKNGGSGIGANTSCTLVGNAVSENEGKGISNGIACTVVNNTVLWNKKTGIEDQGGSTITGNTVTSNNVDNAVGMAGISVSGASLVKNNTVVGNNQSNIYVI